MKQIKNYFSLIKFSHTIFAMPFALIGFFLGIKDLTNINTIKVFDFYLLTVSDKASLFFKYKWWIFVLVILCMIFARSAAMAFNRWLDAKYDALNPRTAIREIPAGKIKSNHALFFTIINCILFIICTYFINSICFYLSPIALFVILIYSYTKRFTLWCHIVLGIGLSLAPIGSYLAVTGLFSWLPILFSLTVLFWVSGFDIIYALQDELFDKQNKLHSIPVTFGKTNALKLSIFLHIISAASVMYAGFVGHFGWLYWFGIVVFIGLLIYQHFLVKPTDLSKVNMAFFTTNGIASVVFSIFVLLDLFLN